MAITNFGKIKIGEFFVVDGESYKKHDELCYVDGAGIQRYIDPLFDAKIGSPKPLKKDPNIVDTSAKIVKGDDEPKPEKKSKKKSAKKGK